MIPPLLYNSRSSRTYSTKWNSPVDRSSSQPTSQPASRRARQPSSRPAIQQPRPPRYSEEQPTDPSWNSLRPWIMKTNRSSSTARPFSSSLVRSDTLARNTRGSRTQVDTESLVCRKASVCFPFSLPQPSPAKLAAANGKRNWA